jgi:hypothetical protein
MKRREKNFCHLMIVIKEEGRENSKRNTSLVSSPLIEVGTKRRKKKKKKHN